MPIPRLRLDGCITASDAVQSMDDFKAWARTHVSAVLQSGCMACGHGRITSSGVLMDHVVVVDYPVEHLRAIRNAAGGIDTPLMRRWLATRRPVYFDAAVPWPDIDREWLGKFIAADLRNGVADAVYDEPICIGTYFSFHRLPAIDVPFLEAVLPELTPVLHRTLMRVISCAEKQWANASACMSTLSQREQEVAEWIGKGKSNAEIAQLLSISENTVRNYLSHIMDKTGCANRTGLAVMVSQWAAFPLGIGTKVL